jgi:hypothetical protein
MKQVFPIVPAPGSAYIVLAVISGVLFAVLILMVYLAYSMRSVQFEVSSRGLTIAGDVYGRTIPAADLMADDARSLDLTVDCPYRLRMRTNGVALPGYGSGWFRMNNGGKALAFLTDRTHVVYIPTRQNYSVLLSVADPAEFIRALKTVQ